ncbi:MAG: hypothetical protein ACI4MV_04925 [Christensenellales bacterium]
MKKRLIVIALIVTMLLSAIALVGCNPNADNNDDQGQNGENNGMPSMIDFAIENIDWLCALESMFIVTNKCPEYMFSAPYGENILGSMIGYFYPKDASMGGVLLNIVILDKEYEVIDEDLDKRILDAFSILNSYVDVSSYYVDKNIVLQKTVTYIGGIEYTFPYTNLNDYISLIDVTKTPQSMTKFYKEGLENVKSNRCDLSVISFGAGGEYYFGGENEEMNIGYETDDTESTQEYIDEFNGKIASGEYLEGSYIRVEDGVTYECVITKRS